MALVLSLCGSWRYAYFIFGSIGIVLGLAFLRWNDAVQVRREESAVRPGILASIKALFRCPTALLCAFAYIIEVFAGYGYSTWGPKFIAKKFGLSPETAGVGVMFWHYAAAFAAILASGWLTDRLVRRYPRSRLAIMSVTQIVAAPMLLLFAFSPTLASVWAAAAVFGISRGAYGANQFAAIFDVVDPRCRAGVLGFVNVLAGLVGSLAPLGIGWLSQEYGNRGFEYGFATLGGAFVMAFAALAVAHFMTFDSDLRRERPA